MVVHRTERSLTPYYGCHRFAPRILQIDEQVQHDEVLKAINTPCQSSPIKTHTANPLKQQRYSQRQLRSKSSSNEDIPQHPSMYYNPPSTSTPAQQKSPLQIQQLSQKAQPTKTLQSASIAQAVTMISLHQTTRFFIPIYTLKHQSHSLQLPRNKQFSLKVTTTVRPHPHPHRKLPLLILLSSSFQLDLKANAEEEK